MVVSALKRKCGLSCARKARSSASVASRCICLLARDCAPCARARRAGQSMRRDGEARHGLRATAGRRRGAGAPTGSDAEGERAGGAPRRSRSRSEQRRTPARASRDRSSGAGNHESAVSYRPGIVDAGCSVRHAQPAAPAPSRPATSTASSALDGCEGPPELREHDLVVGPTEHGAVDEPLAASRRSTGNVSAVRHPEPDEQQRRPADPTRPAAPATGASGTMAAAKTASDTAMSSSRAIAFFRNRSASANR